MRRVCASGEAQRVSIIPRARARETLMCRSALSQAGSRRLVVGVGSSVRNVQCHLACGKRACWVRCTGEHHSARARAGERLAWAAVAWPASGCASEPVSVVPPWFWGDFFGEASENMIEKVKKKTRLRFHDCSWNKTR